MEKSIQIMDVLSFPTNTTTNINDVWPSSWQIKIPAEHVWSTTDQASGPSTMKMVKVISYVRTPSPTISEGISSTAVYRCVPMTSSSVTEMTTHGKNTSSNKLVDGINHKNFDHVELGDITLLASTKPSRL